MSSIVLLFAMESLTWEGMGVIFSILVSIIGSVVAYLHSQRFDAERLAKLEVKVDTLWDVLFRRSVSEAVSKGLAEVNSPLVVNERVRVFFEPLRPELIAWRECMTRNHPGSTMRDLIIGVENKFGDRILSEIALPNNISHDACLLLAVAISTGDKPFDLPVDLSADLLEELRKSGTVG